MSLWTGPCILVVEEQTIEPVGFVHCLLLHNVPRLCLHQYATQCSAPSVPFWLPLPGRGGCRVCGVLSCRVCNRGHQHSGTTIHWAHQQVGQGPTLVSDGSTSLFAGSHGFADDSTASTCMLLCKTTWALCCPFAAAADGVHRMQGRPRSILVECGQHEARQSVEVAKRCICRLVLGPGWQRGHPAAHAAAAHPAAAHPQQQPSASALEPMQGLAAASTQAAEPATQPSAAAGAGAVQAAAEPFELTVEPAQALRTAGSVYVGSGFRWRQDVTAFQLVSRGDVIAEVGTVCCYIDYQTLMPPSVSGQKMYSSSRAHTQPPSGTAMQTVHC